MSNPKEKPDERDHRRLGRALDLFSFSDAVGAGLPLWHPTGARVRAVLEGYWRREHYARGYEIVFTPHVGRSLLWEKSGHLEFYRDAMFAPLQMEGEPYYVKPMNCPFHMQIYASRRRSYRELPIRYAELGTVYRFERSGVLSGLLRVRGFTQDDAHIFCDAVGLEDELVGVVDFVKDFLAPFHFEDLRFRLGTKPDKAVGDADEWKSAIDSLSRAVDRAGLEWAFDEGGGAFYGPKLDVHARDALGRSWQLSTVQFDFNLPRRFELSFVGPDGNLQRPYVVHRALFGSLERFFAILVEHYGGAFPLWLAPTQARVIPVGERHRSNAREIQSRAVEAGLRVEADERNEPLAARIRDGEIAKIPQLAVVGDREAASGSVSVRTRGSSRSEAMDISVWFESLRRVWCG